MLGSESSPCGELPGIFKKVNVWEFRDEYLLRDFTYAWDAG
jgi:hypothetical protein